MTIAATVRSRKAATSQPRKWGAPTGVLIGGVAAASIAVAAILFKPASLSTKTAVTTNAVATPMVALNQTAPTQAARPLVTHKILAAPHAKPKTVAATPAARPTATAQPTPAATAPPSTPRPATPKPATPKPIAAAPPQHKATSSGAAITRRQQLYQPASGSVVALGGIEAFYGPRGHAVRVLWSAAEQASANVQLIDDRGTTVSSTFRARVAPIRRLVSAASLPRCSDRAGLVGRPAGERVATRPRCRRSVTKRRATCQSPATFVSRYIWRGIAKCGLELEIHVEERVERRRREKIPVRIPHEPLYRVAGVKMLPDWRDVTLDDVVTALVDTDHPRLVRTSEAARVDVRQRRIHRDAR